MTTMKMTLAISIVALASGALAGCALGIGSATSGDARAHAPFAFGASAGASLAHTRVTPATMPTAATYGWNLHGGVIAMHEGLGGALEYESRYEEGDYAGGFGTMLRSQAIMAYGAFSPVEGLGLDLGAGYIHGGKFGFGGRGNVADDSAASRTSASVSGFRTAFRLNWQLFEAGGYATHTVRVVDRYTGASFVGTRTDLPLSTALQLECAYAWVGVGDGMGLPDKAQTMSISGALVLSFF